MNPLSTNGVEPVILRGLEKRADDRDRLPRRKRPAVRAETADDDAEHNEEPVPDIPKHQLDDLA
jgi:hypothetical protein